MRIAESLTETDLTFLRPAPRLAGMSTAAAFPSRVEIDLAALAANVRWLRAWAGPRVALMAVIKANAYGHGAVAVARTALENGARMLAVANMAEALELRESGVDAPILVLSYVPPEAIPLAIAGDIALSVFDEAFARRCLASSAGTRGRLKVHLKVDSGMGRLGILPGESRRVGAQLRQAPGIRLEGIYTHFATADDDAAYLLRQLACFKRVLAELGAGGLRFEFVHAANSAALLNSRDSFFNVVRPGVMLYGLAPMPGCDVTAPLRPVMSWKTRVAQVKTLPPDSPVGYGNAYRTRGRETIAILPVGYADGLRRSPNAWREVLIRGRRAPLVGRVSMEKITVNVSHIAGVRIGDEATLLGRQGGERISADEIADWIGSNNYEVVTSIAPRVPRSLPVV